MTVAIIVVSVPQASLYVRAAEVNESTEEMESKAEGLEIKETDGTEAVSESLETEETNGTETVSESLETEETNGTEAVSEGLETEETDGTEAVSKDSEEEETEVSDGTEPPSDEQEMEKTTEEPAISNDTADAENGRTIITQQYCKDSNVQWTLYVVYDEKTDYTYTGEPIKPKVTVYYGSASDIKKAKANGETDESTLTEEKLESEPGEPPAEYAYGLTKLQEYVEGKGGDYVLSYGANTAKGKNGKVIIRGVYNYSGNVTSKFTINPKEIYSIYEPEE